jgi:hypothetical protein
MLRPPDRVVHGLRDRVRRLFGQEVDKITLTEMVASQLDGLLATFARRAAAMGNQTFVVSRDGHFVGEIGADLARGLEISPYAAPAILDRLLTEFVAFLKSTEYRRNWGQVLIRENDDVVIRVDLEGALRVPGLGAAHS